MVTISWTELKRQWQRSGLDSHEYGMVSFLHINTLMTNGFTHHYHLGESTLIFEGFRCDFKILFHFSMKFL